MELLQHGQFSPIASEQTPHSPHPYTPYPPIISSQNFLITFIACHLYINFVTVVIEVLINTSMPHTHCDPVTSYSDHSFVDLSSKVFFGILHFYQTRSAWSMDQGSIRNCSAFHNFVPTVTKFCVMWEGLSLPHDTKFGNCRGEIVDRRVIFILILDPWIKLIQFDKSGAWDQFHKKCL